MTIPYVTFSRNVFIPLTNICRNRCAYCGFRREMEHPEAALLTTAEVETILSKGAHAGCTEALFTFGERPEEVPGFKARLSELGYETIIDHLVELCKLSISKGLLPHCNPGVIGKDELEKLKPYNASMGLMLETTALVEAHRGCAGKDPKARLETIENAGKSRIPFTTGILIGIGETHEDRVRSIEAITRLHEKYGHIQEVIVQNFAPKPGTGMASYPAPGIAEIKKTVTMARELLPPDVAVQVPPNLINPKELVKCGASDLGGISPVTIDYINPEEAWPGIPQLREMAGVPLRERLPIYPGFVREKRYSKELAPLINKYSDPEGFRKPYL
ncbi:MAG: 7,8-didemethyl-8-hydroxy-5-deazariboflavin synthase subunit CofG [Candidatus Methanoperedens sp.]|jgi:FO synthase subunit 1|nr:7,8-didemethyl-8-hydroxy-5-deazariboflavin synthase subunit CofG [Candidatus Methanoperedens sp.]PKL53105.1 MAG: 7,8-didemethyl-8-hydroxy-5-deazariboflavin synthase subunit CofG [Candidatus Methanoperedenaceae archaeon HGW-Methanoperedenaceae-1]